MSAVDPALVAAEKVRFKTLEASFVTGTIGQFVTERCAALGDRLAINVFDRAETATYIDVERRSNQIANALRKIGVAKGDRVAVMLPNCIDYPLIWFALAKIGAVHVPVNTRYTPREIEYVATDSGASLAIVGSEHINGFQRMSTRPARLLDDRVLVVDGTPPDSVQSFAELVDAADTVPYLDVTVRPDDLMNIQYTSGTTGFPKGCMLSHEYWLMLSWAAEQWDCVPVSRLMTAQPFFYMDPQWHVLKSMRLGATLFMGPQLSASRFIDWVKQYHIDWCQFPILMTRQPPSADDGATNLKQVAVFGWDGETCRDFKRRFGVTAREGFGMTEIGLGTLMPASLEVMHDSGSVGLDGPFRETTIRDDNGQPVAAGGRGELWVRGRGIMKGYWQRPEANADSFCPAEDGGLPWFRTGDLFEADDKGFLWLVGRIKDMIRRSSENISAREVEAIVREMPGIEDCAAVPVPDAKRGEEVKIYVQLKDGIAQSVLPLSAIRAHCQMRLAAFKVPRFYTYAEDFPRTVSNKIEKRNLIAGIIDLRTDAWDAENSEQNR